MTKKHFFIFLFILLLIPLALAITQGDSCTAPGQIDPVNSLFCDTDLIWTAQLEDCNETVINCECQNNYECISLKCYNGYCGGITYEEEIAEQESFFENIWNIISGAEEECESISDCHTIDNTIPFCRDGVCEQYCETNSECQTLGSIRSENLNFCDNNGYCVECLYDTDCTDSSKPYCDSVGDCVECLDNDDCESDEYCSTAGVCIKETEEDGNGNGNGGGKKKYWETGYSPDETVVQEASQSYCGDGTCYFGETYANCPADCSPTTQQSVCGDGVPDYPIENCETCPLDVQCEEDEVCDNGECIEKSSFWTWFIIIILILALSAIIIVYVKTRKPKKPAPIKPAAIQQPQQRTYNDFFKKPVSQLLIQRQRQLAEQRRQQQILEQRRQQFINQQKQQQEQAQKKIQQLQTQKQKQAFAAKTKQQQEQAKTKQQTLLTQIQQQKAKAQTQQKKIQVLMNKKPKQQYKKDLLKIAGIGEKTAKNIMRLYPTKKSLKFALISGKKLPFNKIIIQKLKRNI